MSSEEKLITFIVPAYNVENFLDDCLGSLLNQTVADHKVIIVNDGSTDDTGEIAKDYAMRHPEIFTYYFQENRGLGAARNLALPKVDTPYTTFLDSDDWQDCRFVEKLKIELSRHDEMPDIVFTLPTTYDSVTREIGEWRDKALLNEMFYPLGGDERIASFELKRDNPNWYKIFRMEVSSCRRVYKTEYLKTINLQFSEGVKWEDVWPHFLSLHRAKFCIALRGSGFIYRVNSSRQITSGGGATRLDIAPVFQNVLRTALQEKWPKEEISAIIDTFRDFAIWSIRVTNLDYISPLLEELHKAFGDISAKWLKAFRNMSGCSKKDYFAIMLLRSPFYSVLRDYRIRKEGMRLIERLKRVKNVFKRG